MAKITITDLKQELMEIIKEIDKNKVTVSDLKTLAETINILSTIKENQLDYMDAILKITSTGFGNKPTTVSDLKGAE